MSLPSTSAMRRGGSSKATPLARIARVGRIDVVDSVIEDRAAGRFGAFGRAQHQPGLAALEEGEAGRGVEQMGEAEHVAVEGLGAVEVADGIGDLGDTRGIYGPWLPSSV